MAKKPARKPSLTPMVQDQIRIEYGRGDTVAELSRKYDRGTSIISRIINGVSRDGEKLANRLAEVRADLGTRPDNEQTLIIQRSEQIQKIKERAIKGTNYIMGRTLNKLQGLDDEKINFNDLSQAQGVMNKASALIDTSNSDDDGLIPVTGIRLVD